MYCASLTENIELLLTEKHFIYISVTFNNIFLNKSGISMSRNVTGDNEPSHAIFFPSLFKSVTAESNTATTPPPQQQQQQQLYLHLHYIKCQLK